MRYFRAASDMTPILDKLDSIKARFDELGIALTNPEVVSDNKRFTALSREYRKLEPIVEAWRRYRATLDSISFGKEVLANETDEDLREMAREELEQQEERQKELEDDRKSTRLN